MITGEDAHHKIDAGVIHNRRLQPRRRRGVDEPCISHGPVIDEQAVFIANRAGNG